MKSIVIFALVVLASSAFAYLGVDVSEPVSVESFQCLKANGYDFVSIRCWEQADVPDPNCVNTLQAAWAGGMAAVDLYFYPCVGCRLTATEQAQGVRCLLLISYLQSHGISLGQPGVPGQNTYGNIWLDIEGPQYWSSNQQDNQDFVTELVVALKQLGQRIAIYTSASQWIPIFGDWTAGDTYPLWYAHYDNNPSFSDFQPFAGWTSPVAKQYQGTTSLCGASVDLDFTELTAGRNVTIV